MGDRVQGLGSMVESLGYRAVPNHAVYFYFHAHAHNPKRICPEPHTGVNEARRGEISSALSSLSSLELSDTQVYEP